ncbi:MAG: toprim domain-containing protein [Paracoccaceae bacterium]|nr:toprim domain-containing protein [Paracoccaceae bacterium]
MTNGNSLTQTLGGHWRGRYGTAPCPVCQPERRSDQDALTISDGADGRLLLHCKKLGCAFGDVLAASGIAPGSYAAPDPDLLAQRERERQAEADRKARHALSLWHQASSIEGTPGETYLRGRGIICPMPPSLRFHPALRHPSGLMLPAMVALVEGADRPAVHRTFLAPDGTGKAQVDPQKAMLGAVAGGAVRLVQAEGALVVAEGIETALSLASGLLRAPASIWAALSASGMRGLRLPHTPGDLIVATDGDQAGRDAGHDLALRAHKAGWSVSMLHAPDGMDWNDHLRTVEAHHE